MQPTTRSNSYIKKHVSIALSHPPCEMQKRHHHWVDLPLSFWLGSSLFSFFCLCFACMFEFCLMFIWVLFWLLNFLFKFCLIVLRDEMRELREDERDAKKIFFVCWNMNEKGRGWERSWKFEFIFLGKKGIEWERRLRVCFIFFFSTTMHQSVNGGFWIWKKKPLSLFSKWRWHLIPSSCYFLFFSFFIYNCYLFIFFRVLFYFIGLGPIDFFLMFTP